MLPADRCYPKPLRAPTPRRFPCDVTDDLRHPRRAGRARCFTTPKPAGRDPQRCSGRHFFLLRALGPSSGRPCRNLSRGPDLREEESRCHSALAEDPRGDRRDRFRRRSVKTADFPDPGRLPSVSTLRGCSFVRVALPPAPDPSSFLSSLATERGRVRPLATQLRGSPRGGASLDPTTLTDFCNTTDERTHRERLDSR
jgi:hypothetical protein